MKGRNHKTVPGEIEAAMREKKYGGVRKMKGRNHKTVPGEIEAAMREKKYGKSNNISISKLLKTCSMQQILINEAKLEEMNCGKEDAELVRNRERSEL